MANSPKSCICKIKICVANHAIILLLLLNLILTCTSSTSQESEPKPKPWPEQFHSILVLNFTSKAKLQINDLWYDWPSGRNVNLIQSQLGSFIYDVEWNNGTSYYYTLDHNQECRTEDFGVGIPLPNWIEGGNYLGQRHIDGFLCNVWEKAEFAWYYEDVSTNLPVHISFYDGLMIDFMNFEVGAVLEESKWQAPAYCFGKEVDQNIHLGGERLRLLRGYI